MGFSFLTLFQKLKLVLATCDLPTCPVMNACVFLKFLC